jgi:hypothetical protein
MAIVTDPDILTRFSVIFGAKTQRCSVYPVGDTQRGDTGSPAYANDAYFANTSTIVRTAGGSGAWTGVVNSDVVCVLTGDNAGHYYVNNNVNTTVISIANIDLGTSGAQHTALANNTLSFDAVANVDPTANIITITAHGYVPGDAVVLDAASPPTGLTSGTVYYVIVEDSANIRLATSYSDALSGTGVNITADGTGTANLHERVVVAVFNNGANTTENVNGNPTGGDADGDIFDGLTLQAAYSFGKEEWRNDVDLDGANYNDDLIKHQFPFEAITSEQFEIGGGTAHDNWNWFNEYTRKKVRTGGWAEKTTVSAVNDLSQQTGIVTLGALDADTQVYYQQTSATTAPTDFTFLGAINEAILIYQDDNQDGTPDSDFRTFLKLFARKKGKTYVQSEIADIGVSTIQTIVNRFPLAHADDAAIVSTDAEILSTSPYRDNSNNASVTDAIDGSITAGGVTFTDADATFQTWEVVAGDTLIITNTSDAGSYTIASVGSQTQLTIATDFEFSGWGASNSAVSYDISSYYKIADKTTTPGTAAVVITGSTTSGSNVLTDTTEDLSVAAVGDILWTQEAGQTFGLYKVTGVTDSNNIIVDDTDQPFTTCTAVDYVLLESGMYLQFKDDLTQQVNAIAGATTIEYNDTNATYGNRPTITLTGVSWDASVEAGTMLDVEGSTGGLNDGAYTVFARETAQIVSLVPTDVLLDETDTGPVISDIFVREGWKRDIGGTVYAFNWKITGNGGGLDDIYQYIQHQLRQPTDIDFGSGTARGDITDLLMSFASPTGTTLNLYPDDLDTNDINNITLQDHSGVNRNFPFVAAGSLVFNTNLSTDTNAKFWLFFTNDDAGDNLGRDFGTKDAIIVKDASSPTPLDIAGNVPQNASGSSVAFTYDYDNNVQRGASSAATTAPVTLVCIGLDTAQYVISTGSITRATGITISAVAALERNYLNE